MEPYFIAYLVTGVPLRTLDSAVILKDHTFKLVRHYPLVPEIHVGKVNQPSQKFGYRWDRYEIT